MDQAIIERIGVILREQFAVVPAAGAVSADTEFDKLGVDSLVMVELALILRREYDVTVTEEDLVDSRTLGGAAGIVASRLAPAS
jgi:acyl carrier protein